MYLLADGKRVHIVTLKNMTRRQPLPPGTYAIPLPQITWPMHANSTSVPMAARGTVANTDDLVFF
jgi:hypothetical protein